jgi:S1-C subfamily serine protease
MFAEDWQNARFGLCSKCASNETEPSPVKRGLFLGGVRAPRGRVINVVQKAGMANEDQIPPESVPPQFRRFFHKPEDQTEERSFGQGSGIIIREDGYILTNGHVIEDTEKIEIRLHDGRVFKGRVQGADPQSDLAVLKIDAKGLPTARLADSGKTRVGEFAIAIGAPFNLR